MRRTCRSASSNVSPGTFDEDATAADMIHEYEIRIAARLVGKQALELEFLRGRCEAHRKREARLHPWLSARRHVRRRRMPADGDRTLDLQRSAGAADR
jgi:hypothetical protein